MKLKFYPYYKLARLNNIWGAFLLMFPSLWSLVLYYDTTISVDLGFTYFTVFVICSFLMRSFGCVINDILDQKIDKHVERTKQRPIAAGEVSTKEAIIFAIILLIISGSSLFILPFLAQMLSIFSIVPVILYPLFKRFFAAPQLMLGLTFNWGILLGASVMTNSVPESAIYLYIASIFWTLIYDTVYAYQDYEDDIKIGTKSLAVLLGDKSKLVLLFLYTPIIMFLTMAGLQERLNIIYFIIACVACLFLSFALIKTKYKNPSSCFVFFKLNVAFAFMILIAIFLGKHFNLHY